MAGFPPRSPPCATGNHCGHISRLGIACVDRPRGARLIVVAQRMDSGDEHLELSTPVAEIEQIDACTCLEWNARRVVGALGLADDTVYYKRTFLLRAPDVASLDDAISYVAAWGDGIETAIVDSGGQPL